MLVSFVDKSLNKGCCEKAETAQRQVKIKAEESTLMFVLMDNILALRILNQNRDIQDHYNTK